MTFDEFLIKKKIDRKQFGLAEPALLAEFSHDYAQMGEKSFDHTKKYWFNQLRRRFHLAETSKTEVVKEVTEAALSKNETQENLVSPAAQPKPAFKPRFAAGKTSVQKPADEALKAEENLPVKEASSDQPENSASAPKPAFKPRFVAGKTGVAKPADETPKAEENLPVKEASAQQPENSAPAPKPAFKPRFVAGKTGVAKPADETPKAEENLPVKEASAPGEKAPVAPKLGFKPRFKAPPKKEE